MKKTASLLLSLCLLLSAASALADVDLTYVKENPDIFEVYEGEGTCSISTTMTSGDLSFEHAHESEYYYSSTYFELWILDGEDVIYPVLSVNYCADDPLNITAVSFDVEGVRYTFQVEPDEPTQFDNGISEDHLIFFGPENIAFLAALENIVDAYDNADDLMENRITAILHGDEDLTVTLSDAFLLDYYIVIKDAFLTLNGMDTFDKLDFIATPMTMEEIGTEEPPADPGNTDDEIAEKLRNMFNK